MDLVQKLTEDALMQVKLNKKICTGVAVSELAKTMTFLEGIFRSVFHNRIEGFKFINLERCTPHDTVNTMRTCISFDGYDINKSNLFMVRVNFTYTVDGVSEVISREFVLIYADDAGLTMLGGALYNIRAVLYDKFLSPSKSNVFIRLYKDKSCVHSLPHTVRMNGDKQMHATVTFIIPRITKSPLKKKNTPRPPLLLYILTKFAYKKGMMKLLGYVPEIVRSRDAFPLDTDNYTYFHSNEMSGYKVIYMKQFGDTYTPTDLVVKVKKSDIKDEQLLTVVVTNLFYILDHFRDTNASMFESKGTWITILSTILYGEEISLGTRYTNTLAHLASLDTLVDVSMVERIHLEFNDSLKEDFEKDGYYAILLAVIKNFNTWVRSANGISSSCYDKRIENLYSVFYHIIVNVNKLANELSSITPGNTKHVLFTVNRNITPGMIYSIKKRRSNEVLVLDNVSVIADNRVLSVTPSTCLQLNLKSSGNSNAKTNSTAADSSTLLHPSQMIGGTLNAISKARLAPLSYLNIFAPFKNGTIEPDQRMIDSMLPLTRIIAESTRMSQSFKVPKEFLLTLDDIEDVT